MGSRKNLPLCDVSPDSQRSDAFHTTVSALGWYNTENSNFKMNLPRSSQPYARQQEQIDFQKVCMSSICSSGRYTKYINNKKKLLLYLDGYHPNGHVQCILINFVFTRSVFLTEYVVLSLAYLTMEFILVPIPISVKQCRQFSHGSPAGTGNITS